MTNSRPTHGAPTIEPVSALDLASDSGRTPPGRRRWIPATAILGGLLGAGLLFTSTAGAAEPVGSIAAAVTSDDGGTSDTAEPSGPAAPSADIPAASGTEVPVPSADGPVAPPAGGPAAPSDGTALAPPAPGAALPVPAAPGEVPAPPAAAPAVDGSEVVVGIVVASSDTTITVQPDTGDAVTVTFTADTRFRSEPPAPGGAMTPTELTAADLSLGSRVEIRVIDGSIVDAGLVVAHVDGTVTAVSSSTASVVTREGLKISLDLSSADASVAVGDHVHARGTVDPSGSTVEVSSIEVAEH